MDVNSPCKNARRSTFPAVATLLADFRDQLITSKMHEHGGFNFLNLTLLSISITFSSVHEIEDKDEEPRPRSDTKLHGKPAATKEETSANNKV